ncbi:hypothetical protein D0Z07_2949 [Hyphodiscus hymeniophilus]|uniref:Uncharacterized protein n=1 Tax=Hyphodiscus hymeniophilus TaxID=353542 RepID=A0A9P7AYR9_9HELO|nr:hypothetical protein D0Z07_2949 [Hyphodiscus hymeniophilus]
MRRNRTITLCVAIATLASNIISSVLFHQLPDDPLHLARNFGWYLHLANVLSVFGFIGALREHALSIAIFANYLILDTILCSIPRFLVLGLLRSFSDDLCSPAFSSQTAYQTSPSFDSHSAPTYISSRTSNTPDLPYPNGEWDSFSSNWSQEGCMRIVTLAQWTLAAGVVAGTLLQFVGALYVREFARGIWVREVREEERFLRTMADPSAETRRSFSEEGMGGLSIIDEEDEMYGVIEKP